MQLSSDTIFAPATIAGTGALCIIRISGPDTFNLLDSLVTFNGTGASASKGGRIRFGTVSDDGGVLDEVLVGIFRAPHSYTGENSAEISCHSSSYIVSRLCGLLASLGARVASPGEFTMRAYLNGKMDLAQAEAVADVIASEGSASHRLAMNQLRGGYSSQLRDLRDTMLKLCSLVELELDFSEEDVEFADRSTLRSLVADAASRCRTLADSFHTGNALKNGVPVAIIGAPNTGKSTLLNALVGDDRAIVSDIPGTTRDTVEESCMIDGIKFRFIDTAGLRETDETIERLGIERSLKEAEKADIVILLTDASADSPCGCPFEITPSEGRTVLSVRNKCDLIRSATFTQPGHICISAATGEGLDGLRAALVTATRKGTTATDCIVTSERHAAALRSAATSLSDLLTALSDGTPTDLLAEHLRAAISSLNSILGEEITVDKVLGEIFGKFCIGK